MHKLLVANFKMNGNKQFYIMVNKKFNKIKLQDTKVILCPPFVYLPFMKIKNKNISIGAQDVSNVEKVTSTGQISSKMLKEFGVEFCIIGHKEKREVGDSFDVVKQKIYNAVTNGIQPIICVGLNKNEDLNNLQIEVENLLKNQPKFEPIFAYEPNWAIGSNKISTRKEIDMATKIIKGTSKNLNYNSLVIYGGSININNFSKIKNSQVDGFMFGGLTTDICNTIDFIKEVGNE